MNEFLSYISDSIAHEKLFKLTLSKPREKRNQLRNIFFRPITLGEEVVWQGTFRYRTNDQTQNFDSGDLAENLELMLRDTFFNADLFLDDKKVTLLQSKKGKSKVLVSKESHNIQLESHNHKKNRLIPETTPFLIDLGISSTNGKVYGHAQDKFKQINRFIELIASLIKEDEVKEIYDMGSGKGYLTFALHHYLLQRSDSALTSVGIEIREDLVEKCNAIAVKNQLQGLSFELGSIDSFPIEKADMVIALHACDIATDMAIAKGIQADAKYIVVAPCCHKQIRKAMTKTDTNLNPLIKYGILKERQAEMVTDTIRALLLESKGYHVNVMEFISSEHTSKNIMITARKTDKLDSEALSKIDALKKEFGIDAHYLEKLI